MNPNNAMGTSLVASQVMEMQRDKYVYIRIISYCSLFISAIIDALNGQMKVAKDKSVHSRIFSFKLEKKVGKLASESYHV